MTLWLMRVLGVGARGLVTAALLGLCALVLVGWDVWVAVRDDKRVEHNSISEIVYRLAKHPLTPFVFGVLAGHFFWALRSCAPGCLP